MARKSRKKTNEVVVNTQTTIHTEHIAKIPTAVYARLSRENNGGDDTDSLDTQISYITQYIQEHPEYELADVYADNGHTGTDFERAEFMRMMEDARCGRINCIVVKDLSRFGRNHIETGYYIETLLPKLNVKLVAINDHFDSSREADRNGLATPIRNMVNEMYARDLSKKIRAAKEERNKRRDKLPQGVAPYGYDMNEDKTQYIVNEEVADYVRLMYQWALLGDGNALIARRLNFIHALTAGEISKTTKYALKRKGSWDGGKVYEVLINPTHTGDICYGRVYERKFDVNARRGWLDREDWTVHKNTHEPLVPRDDYWAVIDKMKERASKAKARNTKLKERDELQPEFSRMVYCAKCGHFMNFVRYKHDYANDGNYYAAYCCGAPDMKHKHCNTVVYEDYLKIIVMDQVRLQMGVICGRAEELLGDGDKNPLLSVKKKIAAAQKANADGKDRQARLYEDFASGLIEEEDYRILKERCIVDEQDGEARLSDLEVQLRELESRMEELKSLTIEYRDKRDIPEFDGELARSMINRIKVYEKNRIEIEFKHNDLMEYLEKASVNI